MEGFAHRNEFCPNEACPDYGKLQKDQSKPNILKRLVLPELGYSGINAKPVRVPSPRHAGRSSTANARENTKSWKRRHC
jgi:hypothetical protein